VNDTIHPTIRMNPSQSQPTMADTRIHWADSAQASRPDLEQQFEAMRARNWITDRMVQQYQKHWHCSREVALERLLSKPDA
jgi:hypothetical protein